MRFQAHCKPWVSLLIFSLFASAIRQCTHEDRNRPLKPGQCLTQCAAIDGKVTCPGNPPVTANQDECDFLTVVRDSNGKVIDQCCTRDPEKPSKKRPQCGKNFGWLECDPDNGFGSCCSKDGLCGSGDEYCGRGGGGCDSTCDTCPGPRNDRRCGKDFNDAVCKQGQCCSSRGWCGTTDNHCQVERGCQGSCKPSGFGANRCGAQAGGRRCDPRGEFGGCCSKHGFCGTSQAHCNKDQGCQSGCDERPPPKDPDNQKPLIPNRPPRTSDGDDEDPDSPPRPPPKTPGRDREDPDSPSRPPPKTPGRDDEDPESPSRPLPKGSGDDDPNKKRPEDCPPCPACPKTECPPPPKKNPASGPKFDASTANKVLACLCDEGDEPTAHKLAPQKLGCPWHNREKTQIKGKNFEYECFRWQTSDQYEYIIGDSLEYCGELCAADSRCASVNFFLSHARFEGRPACTLIVGPRRGENPVEPSSSVFGGSLKLS